MVQNLISDTYFIVFLKCCGLREGNHDQTGRKRRLLQGGQVQVHDGIQGMFPTREDKKKHINRIACV